MPHLPFNLRYSSDDEPGIERVRRERGFSYYLPDGQLIEHGSELDRIEALGLPPAYENIWICRDNLGHIQATGRDDAGRKQYRYHQHWTEFRKQQKFDNLEAFADALPRIRARVARDMRREYADKRFVSAALIRLIDKGALRVGNRTYSRQGGTTGATTLKRKHIRFDEGVLYLDYSAKGGKRVRKRLQDKALARILQEIDDLPGRDIFQYIGSSGSPVSLDSSDVNAYLDDGFTAKTFRTWHGSVAAFIAARDAENPTLKLVCEAAAKRLHNTAAICRTSYIHPAIIKAVKTGYDLSAVKPLPQRGLREAERACLAWISS